MELLKRNSLKLLVRASYIEMKNNLKRAMKIKNDNSSPILVAYSIVPKNDKKKK